MKQKSIHNILIVLLFFGLTPALYAQDTDVEKGSAKSWYFGISGGTSLFWGDIRTSSAPFRTIQPAFGGFLGKSFSPFLRLEAETNYSFLKGTLNQTADTLNFKSRALSLSVKAKINPLSKALEDSRFSVFLEAGGGMLYWKSLLINQTTSDTLNNLGWNNNQKQIGFFFPAGIQLHYQITQNVSAYFSSSYHLALSDLLDGHITGSKDAYSYTSLGMYYTLGKQKIIPKLLKYPIFLNEYDSIAARSDTLTKKEKKKNTPTTQKEDTENPFLLSLSLPKEVPQNGFMLMLSIQKKGIPASGFFRLLLPSGFLPQAPAEKEVIFTKLGHRYEYDFMLAMNMDSISIGIPVKLSEIAKGAYPVMIEGEVIDQQGRIFPIKFAEYVEVISEKEWNEGLLSSEKKKKGNTPTASANELVKKAETAPIANASNTDSVQNISIQTNPKSEAKPTGIYRIQIAASRKKLAEIEEFKSQHKINTPLTVLSEDGWYRYNIHETPSYIEAKNLLAKVRKENRFPQAFIAYYENGKRKNISAPADTKNGAQTKAYTPKQKASRNTTTETVAKQTNAKPVYRIEFAMAYNKPVPVNVLQSKVGQEKISTFKQDQTYYYTIGEFDKLEVARSFLSYVQLQLKLSNAKIVRYKGDSREQAVL